jgi:ketosteroid isomerase-like protein
VVERYAAAISMDDFDAQDAVLHDDYVLVYPQSRERIRGRANRRAIVEHYPGKPAPPSIGRIIGMDDQFVGGASWPTWSLVHLVGSGDDFQATGTVRYPDGVVWHFVSFMTLRAGKIWRETDYFAPPFDPPAWRSPYVQLEA